jgi:RimJ/RimL family protein N-acetyltransferase
MNPSSLLHGNRVRLTALTSGDLPTFAQWYQDTEFLRFFDSRPAFPKAQPELGRWLEELQKATDGFTFGIRLLNSDGLLGYLELDDIDWQHGVCGLGVGIGDRANWGQGYGFEASQLALEFAFHELNLHRVQGTVFSYNARSQALFAKLGFQREGTYREYLQRDGQRHDMFLYGLLRQEWQAQRDIRSDCSL